MRCFCTQLVGADRDMHFGTSRSHFVLLQHDSLTRAKPVASEAQT